MTDEEVAIFNYLYASQGKDAAHAYYDYLTGDLNYRQRQEEEAYWRDYAKESPVGSSVFSVLTSPMKGLSYLAQAADYLAPEASTRMRRTTAFPTPTMPFAIRWRRPLNRAGTGDRRAASCTRPA